MCFGGGGGDGGAADAAAAEARRRRNIQAGIVNIDKVFNGTDRGINQVNAPVAGQTYYLPDGTAVVLNEMDLPNPAYVAPRTVRQPGGAGAGASAGGPRGRGGSGSTWQGAGAAIPQTIRGLGYNGASGPITYGANTPLYAGKEHTGGFDDAFYKSIEDNYRGYAQPQLDRQYHDATDQLVYALARHGISASTAAGHEQGRLEEDYNKYRTDIASAGKAYAQNTRANVENSRTDLINQLSATEDPIAAGTSAVRSYEANSQMPAFDPVGAFAFNLGEGLKQQSAQNGYKPIFSPSIFSSKPSSSISYYS